MNKKICYICIAITTLLFSTMEIVLKFSAMEVHPIQMTFSRFFIGGLVLLPFAVSDLKKRKIILKKEDGLNFLWLGFMGILVCMTLFQLALIYIEASKVAILFSCNTVFVTVFAFLILGEPLMKNKLIAVCFDIIGIFLVAQPWKNKLDGVGILFVISSAVLFGLYGVLGKKATEKLGSITLTCGSFIIGSIEMMLLSFVGHIPAIAELLKGSAFEIFADIPFINGYNIENIGYLIYLGVFATGIAYASYFKAMETGTAQEVAVIFFIKPVLAIAGSVVILNEHIDFGMEAGMLFILGGSLISIFGKEEIILKRGKLEKT